MRSISHLLFACSVKNTSYCLPPNNSIPYLAIHYFTMMEPTILGPEFYEAKQKAALQRAKEDAISNYRCKVRYQLNKMDLPKYPTRDFYITERLVDDFVSQLPDAQIPDDFRSLSHESPSRLIKKLNEAIREVEGWTKEELEKRAKNAEDVYNDHNRYKHDWHRWVAIDNRWNAASSKRFDAYYRDLIEDTIIDAMRRQQVEPGSKLEASIFHKLRNNLVAEMETDNRMCAKFKFMHKLEPSFMDNLVSQTMAEVGASSTELNEISKDFELMGLDKDPMLAGKTT